ncbi:MAG: hypothetical protein GTO55_10875 [Armatimonadetes bacterium]|nr:hypothetical protein [Armatimonadota bacterium]NIM24733.1 hypothetical protein [Armatimonadota bacterium]NIM68613.1 hypothetical protein [Armatimonadota bacterium]NIM77130.1 hypothetical protein [Armatimonadota bacterium]NIN06807.1 hypothetical protein [Armatimonadota bacterium]
MGRCNPEALYLLVDGEAAEPQVRQMEAHLAQCNECRQVLQDLRQMKALFAGFSEIGAPAGIRARLGEAAARACSQVKPLLGEYLDTELDPVRREALALHFAFCQDCRSEVLALSRLRGLISRLPEVSAPARVREKATEALAKGGARWPQWLPGGGLQLPLILQPLLAGRGRNLGLAAALACAVLALVWLHPFSPRSTTITQPEDRRVEAGERDSAADTSFASEQPSARRNASEHGTETIVSTPTSEEAIASRPIESNSKVIVQARSSNGTPKAKKRYRTEPAAEAVLCSTAEVASTETAKTVEEIAADDYLEDEAGIHVEREKELPTEVAQARTEMVRALERHQVLKTESLLSLLPLEAEVPENGSETPSPPAPDVSAPDSGSWA